MAKKKFYVKDILSSRGLLIGAHDFECPWCHRLFERGGHKEGFVKSGASNHVHACWEILLWQRGYFIGNYVNGKQEAIPVGMTAQEEEWRTRYIRGIKANLRARIKQGNVPEASTMRRHAR